MDKEADRRLVQEAVSGSPVLEEPLPQAAPELLGSCLRWNESIQFVFHRDLIWWASFGCYVG